MSDEADMADENIEIRMLSAIAECRNHPHLQAKGSCWFCDEPLAPEQKFCDRDCASDFELEEAALVRAGKPRHHYVLAGQLNMAAGLKSRQPAARHE
jgi:hypothetical protein